MSRQSLTLPAALVAAGLACGVAASPARAVQIHLNFGATVADNTNSAGHTVGGMTGTSWNLITNADVPSGITDSAGGATSVSVDLGKETSATSKLLDWTATGYSASALGTVYSAGIYAGNAKSATFVNNGSSSFIDMGVRVRGLPAGEYDIFSVSRNTNTSNNEDYNVYFATVPTATLNTGSTDYSAVTPLAQNNAANSATWVAGDNYLVRRLTVAANQDLVVIAEGTTTSENRGFINTIQIATVPEPASGLLAGAAAATLGLLARRRRRGSR